ncbi:unnamed protein product [Calypogeia fissa]
MEALTMASAPQALSSLESSTSSALGVRKSASLGLPSASSSSCCAVPVGLSGDGLSSVRRNSSRLCFSATPSSAASSSSSSPRTILSRRVSRLTSPPRGTPAAAAALVPIQCLEGELPLLKDIDSQDLEAETPSLLQQCSDMDWKKLVDDLRSEALHGLQSSGLRALSLKALEKLMESWIHEGMVDGIERPTAAGKVLDPQEPGWNAEAAASELRMEANLQAAQMLASGVDSTFDWETDVAELHQRILLQGGAEQSLLRPEQRLWSAWGHAQDHIVQTSSKLVEEVLESTSLHAGSIESMPEAEVVGSTSESSSTESRDGKSFLSLSAAVATGLAVEGIWLMDAIADEATPEAVEAASRAPSWLVPAVLIFPPLSYLVFNVYRDKVNPYAKVTDWMFGIVALTIVSNIIMMAVWGVRLY